MDLLERNIFQTYLLTMKIDTIHQLKKMNFKKGKLSLNQDDHEDEVTLTNHIL